MNKISFKRNPIIICFLFCLVYSLASAAQQIDSTLELLRFQFFSFSFWKFNCK